MYSATFAMTIIIGIAATNLFLGFAAAILLGRGPKRWSDIDQAIVLQPVTLRGLQPPPRTTVERVDLELIAPLTPPAPEAEQPAAAAPPSDQATPLPDPVVATKDNGPKLSEATPAAQAAPDDAVEPAARKIVLAPRTPVDDFENDPPEKTLAQQLDSWRLSDLSNETPSVSAIQVAIEGVELDDAVHQLLTEAVQQRIKKQVRKDRRVLNIGSGQFVWFSSDVPPDDALMPVERIRQMLTNTGFRHAGDPLNTTVVAGVVAGMPDDDAERLLKRLRMALQYATEKPEYATCLDIGEGPTGVDPYPIEVEQTECEL